MGKESNGNKSKVILLYQIDEGLNDPDLASITLRRKKEELEKEFLVLEREGLIKIEMREGKIYNSELTEKGKKFLYQFYHLMDDEK